MNNIQQTRIQLEKTYQAMGGSNLLEDAASILNQLQSTLNKVLDQLARQFADSISPKVDKSVQHMGKLLQDVKGGGQGQAISKSEVAAAADGILGPLMDLLDGGFPKFSGYFELFGSAGSLSMYAENCDKSVLKRLLKQLWRIVMNCLEKSIVLPPLNEKVKDPQQYAFHICPLLQKGLKNLDAAGKNVLDASKNVDALMGGFMKKGLNVNVKDAKNVMNAVSVSVQR